MGRQRIAEALALTHPFRIVLRTRRERRWTLTSTYCLKSAGLGHMMDLLSTRSFKGTQLVR